MKILYPLSLLTASCLSMSVMAAEFEFDRPGTGFSTSITPVGKVAWEQGLPTASYQEGKINGLTAKTLTLSADTVLRTGLTEDLELQLGWAGPMWTQHKFVGRTIEDDGLGDVSIALKKSIDLGDDKLSMAVMAEAVLATGDEGFTANDDIYSLSSTVSYQYNPLVNTAITMRYEVQDGDWAVTAVPTIGYKIAGKWSGFSELVYRKSESQDYQYQLGSGLIYALSNRAQLDARMGVDLSAPQRAYQAGLGFSYLF